MQFVSPHPGYCITGVRQARDVHNPHTGKYEHTIPGIDVEFRHGGAPSWAADEALANPNFKTLWGGLPDGIDYRLYIGSYDTDRVAADNGWDEATKAEVEDFLLNHVDFGQRYIHVLPPLAISGKPWPNYDDTHHFQVAKTAKEIGVPLEDVLEYEKRNKKRKSVIEDLEKAIGDPAEVVPA